MLLQCVNGDFCLYIVNSCDFTVHVWKKKKKKKTKTKTNKQTLNAYAQNAQSKWILKTVF